MVHVYVNYSHRKEFSHVVFAIGRFYVSLARRPFPREYVDFELEFSAGLRSKGAELGKEE